MYNSKISDRVAEDCQVIKDGITISSATKFDKSGLIENM